MSDETDLQIGNVATDIAAVDWTDWIPPEVDPRDLFEELKANWHKLSEHEKMKFLDELANLP